ncbi:DNA-binding protein [Muribaculaceae bacterium Isolate-113 (HZI)]|uniref:helix-turn-helix domain-containing protein n=1 Tax=uncultured Duncaniella sp. TaxID=2768039 RepID=UPI000F47D413|nr:helix-turn-helix domain-containing protein [Muribaculaceae bacterium]MCI9030013.1 helix-turn-helix domain-containing protein [Muribaculaceae bacterium]ROT24733.1 DNA-binding protein [Muribaculaceae bacterium Isolate-114 (HZI)]ROT25406.1 DNA-binding protein [Muribaculaceae bacterium Isolate-113 (HZI)]
MCDLLAEIPYHNLNDLPKSGIYDVWSKLLGISPKTWQNYRDQRLIPFSQIGRKIYVNRADLDAFLRQHRIAPRK